MREPEVTPEGLRGGELGVNERSRRGELGVTGKLGVNGKPTSSLSLIESSRDRGFGEVSIWMESGRLRGRMKWLRDGSSGKRGEGGV